MRYLLTSLLAVALAVTAGPAAAATGLSAEHAGFGLKPRTAASQFTGSIGLRSAPPAAWDPADSGEVIYGGVRESIRPGTRLPESFSGVYFPLSETWGGSLESGVVQESLLAPRRYSLAGQLHTTFGGGSGLSAGLKYRVYGSEAGPREYAGADPGRYGYGLMPLRIPGASFGPSYQLQLSYHYDAANIFALALGRELETFTPGFDVPGNGPRLSFTGQHWLTPSWALSYDLLSNDPNSFRLQGLRLGVRYRF